MVETISAKDVTLKQLKTIFDLQLAEDDQFFLDVSGVVRVALPRDIEEWQEKLPEITDWQKQMLDRVKAGYFNLLNSPPLLEKPVNMAIVSPLLFIGEFYLSPFHFKAAL